MQPLSGVRVLDLTRHLPGPWCTMTLGDLGADVLKIERPVSGDTIRQGAPRYEANGRSAGIYFCNVNRNKRSLALDLKSEDGKAELLERVAATDVVVENFRAGTADKLGIGYETMRAINPRIVYCAITGYGQTGPMATMAGHDLSIAGMSGMLQMHADQVPQMPGVLMGDYAGATSALAAILAGLFAARVHGVGSYIDVSMMDALSSWSGVQMTQVFKTGESSARGRVEGWGGNPRYNTYPAADGRYLTVSLLEKELWDRFCRHFGRGDLVNAQESEADRLSAHGARADEYRRFIADTLLQRTRDEWVAIFADLRLPICAVYTPDEWYGSATAAQRECFLSQRLPELDVEVPQMGFPFRMSMADGDAAMTLRIPPPPLDNARADQTAPAASVAAE